MESDGNLDNFSDLEDLLNVNGSSSVGEDGYVDRYYKHVP
jgi:hypothetical protein